MALIEYSICFCLSKAERISPTVLGLPAAILLTALWIVRYSLTVGTVCTAT